MQNHGLETFQITLVPAGTAASDPPTNPFAFENIMGHMPEADGGRTFASGNIGKFVKNTSSRKSSEGGKYSFEWMNLTYEDLAIIGEIAMKGAVSPTGVGPYTWVHNGQSTSDDLARISLQAGGSEAKLQMLNGIASKLTLTGDASEGSIKAAFDVVGSAPTVLSSFASQASYTPGSPMPFGSLVDIFADDTAGGIGTTQLECAAVKGFQLTIDNAVSFVDTTCGRQYGRDRRMAELQLRLLLEDQVWSEVQEQINDVKRFVQVSIPDAASPTYSATFNIAGYWLPYVWGTDGPFRDVTLTMYSEMDDTLGYDWQLTTVNALASVPIYQS